MLLHAAACLGVVAQTLNMLALNGAWADEEPQNAFVCIVCVVFCFATFSPFWSNNYFSVFNLRI